jgi:hypothetical protein
MTTTTSYVTPAERYRAGLNYDRPRMVGAYLIQNDAGVVLADVDGVSTSDALAYYLRSRHIDDAATEVTVAEAAGATADDECIVRRTHDWDGSIIHDFTLVVILSFTP